MKQEIITEFERLIQDEEFQRAKYELNILDAKKYVWPDLTIEANRELIVLVDENIDHLKSCLAWLNELKENGEN